MIIVIQIIFIVLLLIKMVKFRYDIHSRVAELVEGVLSQNVPGEGFFEPRGSSSGFFNKKKEEENFPPPFLLW